MKRRIVILTAAMALCIAVTTGCTSFAGVELPTMPKDILSTEKTTQKATQKEPDNTAIRASIKEFCKSYEDFIDEYCAFMKKYQSANEIDAAGMMGDYLKFTTKLADMESKAQILDDGSWNDAETAYYSEVLLRCSQKILKAAQ